jgi:hypothetical protein
LKVLAQAVTAGRDPVGSHGHTVRPSFDCRLRDGYPTSVENAGMAMMKDAIAIGTADRRKTRPALR